MGFLRWIDRHLWSLPVLVFLLSELGFSAWSASSSRPVLLAAAPLTARQAVYSSLTGSSSGLLGLAVAAVAIIVAFSPRRATGTQSEIERQKVKARTTISGSLLAVSFFLLVAAIAATVALAVDVRPTGNSAITTLIEASGIASIVGLLAGGFGLTLVVVERSHSA